MTQIEYLHVCDYAFTAEGGKPCIIGIFDNIFAATFPATHPMMAIALRFRGSAHELLQVKIELARPSGDAIATMQGEVTIGGDGSSFMQVNMAGVTFPEPGRYVVKVSSAGKTLTSHSLQVQKVQPQTQPAPSGSAPKQFH
jgi:hypothetical protein